MTEPPEDVPAARYVGVGIGTYTEKEYPPLPGAPAEVRQIADLLGARGVHATVAAATHRDRAHRRASPGCCRPGRSGGEVSWSFCGPGTVTGSLTRRCGWSPRTPPSTRAALLTPEYVASVAVRSGATQVLLIFDTCFSGGGALPVLARRRPVVQ